MNEQKNKIPVSKNLMEGLTDEMNRCRDVLKHYESIPQGAFGALMIKQSILLAEDSIKENDVVKMLFAYSELQNIH